VSFARFSYADVYIYEHVGGFIECCGCSLTQSEIGELFGFTHLETPRDAIKHLKEHKKAGDDIGGAIRKIKDEYEDLDAPIQPYERSPEEQEATRKRLRELMQSTEVDMVNHPPHYTSDPSGVEAITVLRHRSYNIGNAMKYLWRAGIKNEDTHIQDLEKAIFYIKDEIKRIQGD
jgi:uncharacterized protein YdcH (DUF465 family)